MARKITLTGTVTLGILLGVFCVGIAIFFLPEHYFSGVKKADFPKLSLSRDSAITTAFGWKAHIIPIAGEESGQIGSAAHPARLEDPFGIAIDRFDDLYVADGVNNSIHKITQQGVDTIFAGGKEGFANGSTGATFNTPSGLAIDDSGNVYVADTGNNAIRKITPKGEVSTIAGDGNAGFRDGAASQAQFNGPIGIAVDHAGNIYVADTYNDRIRRITAAGQVSTLAGGTGNGYADGPAAGALFDTPCALAVGVKGELFIADTRNNAIRTLNSDGQVGTLARTLPNDRTALWRRPIGLASTADGFLYFSEMGHGRILQISPSGDLRGLTGVDIDFPSGDNTVLRFSQPVAMALDKDGALLVADSVKHAIRKVTPKQIDSPNLGNTQHPPGNAPALEATRRIPSNQESALPWPLKPQNAPHEIVGTMGEVRGNVDGESRDHFHAGVDVRANMGTAVLAVADGKITDPLPAWGYDDLSEGLSIGNMSYIHMRVGRTANDVPIDPARFAFVADASGKPRVRIKRGTRFYTGDTLGTVNRMYHVHLEYNQSGVATNLFALGLVGFSDHVAPRIESIQLFDQDGRQLSKKRGGRLLVPSGADALSLVVGAYDQSSGNDARRRLGLYKIGFQILRADGTPMQGFEQPQVNLEFNQLPPDRDSVKIAYAEGSGETVHGSAVTRFLYIATNTVRDGHAAIGFLRAADFPKGNYLIRIYAVDYAGNVATTNRDLAISLE